MVKKNYQKIISKVPESCGVYKFYDREGKLLYIGKSFNLKKRVSQYFLRLQNNKTASLVAKIYDVQVIQTDSNLEALILESSLINRYQPPYNILQKDDKTFGGIFITNEEFPRVFSARKTAKLVDGEWFGPYVSGKERVAALKVLRRIFKWCSSPSNRTFEPQRDLKKGGADLKFKTTAKKPCFYYQLGLCSGACVGECGREEYQKQIRYLKMFLKGKKNRLISELKKEMEAASGNEEFEKAKRYRDELRALTHISESALVTNNGVVFPSESLNFRTKKMKIEAYDIANISDSFIVGGMAVYRCGAMDSSQYRRFKIKTVSKQNDIKAIKEMVSRRLRHKEWRYPDLILVDGGVGHINAVRQVLFKRKLTTPVVGLAKGRSRKKNELQGNTAFVAERRISLKTLVVLRNEAHRFARGYFHFLQKRKMLEDV